MDRGDKKMQSMDNLRNVQIEKHSSRTSEHDSCWVKKTAYNEVCNSSCNLNSANCRQAGGMGKNGCCLCCWKSNWSCKEYDMEGRIRYLEELEKMAGMM